MVISLKDGIKLVGVAIVCFCAVFVCTFFLNYYADAVGIADSITAELQTLYDAQIATAKVVCFVTGGVLCLIAVIMTVFYIKLFVDGNAKRFAVLKAMGYSDGRLAASFWVFGLSVLIGAALGCGAGYAIMPKIYELMTINGLPHIEIGFHAWVPVVLVLALSIVFAAISIGYARMALRKNIWAMMRGNNSKSSCGNNVTSKTKLSYKDRPFKTDMALSVLRSKKSSVFFVTLSSFCFSAMLQMGMSMRTLSSVTMGVIMFAIGMVLAVTTLIMAVTTVINRNALNIAVMKAFGYTVKERVLAVLIGYVPFAFLGFGLGTVYQYGLLKIMVEIVFSNVAAVPDYSFDVPMFFITLASFIVAYALTVAFYARRISKISVEIMSEE